MSTGEKQHSKVTPLTDRQRSRKRVRVGKRMTEVMDGDIKLEDLSVEELARGQIKDKNGGWSGAPPKWVPRAFHEACQRELLRRGQQIYKENYLAALKGLADIATDPDMDASARIKAANMVIERIEGKVPDKVIVAKADPWEDILAEIIEEQDEEKIRRARDSLTEPAE